MSNDIYDDALKGLSTRLLALENRPRTALSYAVDAYFKKLGEEVPLGPQYPDPTPEMITKAISDNKKIKAYEFPLDSEC